MTKKTYSMSAQQGASYVVVATEGELTEERVLTPGSGIDIQDNGPGSTVVISALGGGVDEFIELIDAPSSYVGQGGKVAAVKTTEDGLEFSDAGAGDMLKSVYDQDDDGIVDAAEVVPWIGVTGKPSTFPPDAHASSHQNAGGDEISVAGLSGLLADAQTPTAHDLGGSVHNADILANLNAKISDADIVALAGQLGGSPGNPDIRGIRETSGPTLLTVGSVADGQYVRRSGTALIGDTPAGGATPAWHGAIYGAMGGCDPSEMLRAIQTHGVVSPTPTNITASIARCTLFRPPANITVNRIRFYGVGATTGIYRVAIYRYSDRVRMALVNDFATAVATWGSLTVSVSLVAGVLYFIAVAVDTTGTTPGIAAVGPTVAATTGQIATIPGSLPGNLDIDGGRIDNYRFQFAVTTGALPDPAAALAAQAAWTGGMPAFFLDNSSA